MIVLYKRNKPPVKLGAKYKDLKPSEGFTFDGAECESAVVANEVNDFIELLIDETRVVRDDGHSDDGTGLYIIVVHFGDRDVEAAFQSFNYTFYDSALILERTNTV